MSWSTDLAKELKNRDNEAKIGAVVGDVLQINPLKIGILDNKIIIDSSNSYICSSLVEKYERKVDVDIKPYTVNVSATDSRGDSINNISVIEDKKDYDMVIKYKEILKAGDKVLVIASDNNQLFFIIDKLI